MTTSTNCSRHSPRTIGAKRRSTPNDRSPDAQVRANWIQLFETTPDLAVEFSRTTIDGDTAWIALRMHGAQTDEKLDVRGVAIKGISGKRIQWGRIYLEPVQQSVDVTWEDIYAGQGDG
ncbi:nuclear transport factor 2 family protein [Natronorubrum tibetense]|uniref:nuclear transport factor 2 family protein n=1 Tax=Natronorubrum tibetense TaxID=63128 RepID=UPI0012682AE1